MGMESELIIGRKAILATLCLTDWDAVRRLVENEGLPVCKIGGRIIMTRQTYREWLDSKITRGINYRRS